MFAHVQVRGSIPLFWSQKAKKSTKVCFKDNWQKNRLAMNKHWDEILDKYHYVYVLNLLSQQEKPDEARLGSVMNDLINERRDNRLNIYNFDFHARLKGDNYGDIEEIMGMLEPELMNGDKQRFFIQSREKNTTYL